MNTTLQAASNISIVLKHGNYCSKSNPYTISLWKHEITEINGQILTTMEELPLIEFERIKISNYFVLIRLICEIQLLLLSLAIEEAADSFHQWNRLQL